MHFAEDRMSRGAKAAKRRCSRTAATIIVFALGEFAA